MITRRHALALLAAGALPSRALANVAPMHEAIDETLAQPFKDAGTDGTFVCYQPEGYNIIASDKVRSAEPKLPASTYKIPHSVIALETGVVADPDGDIFKWDGVTRPIAAWNRDHTLRSAIAASAVPVYQQIARRIGAERMKKYLDLLEYGNRDIGGVHRSVLADGCLAHHTSSANRFSGAAAARRSCGVRPVSTNRA